MKIWKILFVVLASAVLLSACTDGKLDKDILDALVGGVPVDRVSIDRDYLELAVGESAVLTVWVLPDNASNKNVLWSSSDDTVASVEGGKVTGVKPGNAKITVSTVDGGRSAVCQVVVKYNLAPSVTVGSEHISAVSVALKGKANIGSSVSADLELGIMYSTYQGVIASNSTKVKASDMDGDFNYTVSVGALEPSTTYYYRSYLTENGKDTYGETKSFTTKALSSMIHTEDASNISAVSAEMNATYDLTDVQYKTKTIGIYYGTSAESLSENYVADISAMTGDIIKNWPVLKPSTEYFYQTYIILDSKLYKEEIKPFTTKDLLSMLETKDASNVTPTSAKMNAKLDLTDVQCTTKEYGFYWGTSENSQTTYVNGGEITESAYSASLSDLPHKTQYWYKSYLKVDGQDFYGEVKTFTTDVVTVTDVSLDKAACTIHTIDSTFTLTPTILPSDATNKAVSWKSSNTSVATVDANGKVTAVGNGAATITVTTDDQGKKATCEITVAQRVTVITLDKTALTLAEGQTATLSPTVSPSSANDKSLAWSSSNTGVATVDQNGQVTAVSKGSATIKATAKDGSGKSASCSVTVNKLVTSINLDKSSIVLYNGETATISATVLPETANNRSLAWASSNTSVATVSASGVVTGVARGTATITATAKDGSGKSTTCEVEVKQYVTHISLDKTFLILNLGQTETLVPTVSPSNANDKSVTWSSDNTAVATVDQSGRVTAVIKGTATIKATALDGSGKSATCSVTVDKLVTSITLDKSQYTFNTIDGTLTLTPTVSPSDATNKDVRWKSSNTSVATVDTNGKVTAKGNGLATITATAKDGSGKSATCEITVAQLVTDITLDKTTLALNEGRTVTLVQTVSPSNAKDKSVTWSSNNTAVATVDQSGRVTAVIKGTATIKATAKDGSGISGSCSVAVLQASGVVDLGLSVKWASCNLCESGFASSPEEYGDYYAWGDTEPYYAEGHSQDSPCSSWRSRTNPAITGYNWSSYKWCNGSRTTLTKYNTNNSFGGTVDNKTILEAADDVASVRLGGSWRMPTNAEWTELKNNCTCTWTMLNGINGCLVTSNKNGASIFLPAAGYRGDAYLRYVGSDGCYWSSSLVTFIALLTINAYGMNFKSDGVSPSFDGSRCSGFSVRPVSE